MLDYDAFDMRGGMSDGEYRPLAVMRLRGELFRWYSLQKQEGRTVHELQDFRLSWLGTADRPALSVVKAAESGSLMEFCAYAASRYQAPHGAYAARRSLLRQSVSEWYLGGRFLEFEACSGGPVNPHFRLVSTDHGVLWTRRRAN